MGKFEQQKKKKSSKIILVVICLMVLIAAALFAVPQLLHGLSDDSNTEYHAGSEDTIPNSVSEENGSQALDKIAFPVVLDEGKLEVESLFQFSGVNPDAGRQDVTDIAAVTIRNISDTYLKAATVTAVLGNGSERTFAVQDLPAGKSALLCATDNGKLLDSDVCTEIRVESVFEDVQSEDSVKISVDGMTVTLENISGETLSEIDVYCRDVFGDQYFGGMAYQYTIETLPAGESTTVTVVDSIMGMTEVVRVAVKDQK